MSYLKNGSYGAYNPIATYVPTNSAGSIGTRTNQADFVSPTVLLNQATVRLENLVSSLNQKLYEKFPDLDYQVVDLVKTSSKAIILEHAAQARSLESSFRYMNQKHMALRAQIKKLSDQVGEGRLVSESAQATSQPTHFGPSAREIELESAFKQLQHDLESFKTANERLEVAKSNSDHELTILQQETRSLNKQIDNLRTQLTAASEQAFSKSLGDSSSAAGSKVQGEENAVQFSVNSEKLEQANIRIGKLESENARLRLTEASHTELQQKVALLLAQEQQSNEQLALHRGSLEKLILKEKGAEDAIKSLEKENFDLAERVRHQENQLTEYLSELRELRIFKDKLAEKEAELIKSKASLEIEFEAREKAYRALHERRQQEEAIAKELEARQHHDEIANLEKANKELTDRLAILQRNTISQTESLSSEQEFLRAQKAELDQLQTRLVSEQASLAASRSEFEAKVQQQTKSSAQVLEEYNQQLSSIQDEIRQTQSEQAGLDSEISTKTSELELLSQKLETTKSAHTSFLKQLEDAESAWANIRIHHESDTKKYEAEIKKLQTEQQKLTEENSRLVQETSVATSTREEIAGIRKDLQAQEAALKSAQSALDKERQTFEKIQTELSTKQQQILQFEDLLNARDKQLNQREQDLQQQEKQLKSRESAAEQQLQQAKSAAAKLEAEESASLKKIADLQAGLEIRQKDLDAKVADLTGHETGFKSHTESLATKEAVLSKREEALAKQEQAVKTKEAAADSQLKHAQAELKKVQEATATLQSEESASLKKITSLQTGLEETRRQLDTRQQMLDKAEQAVKSLQESLKKQEDTLKAEQVGHEQQMKEESSASGTLRQELTKLMEENKQSEAKLATLGGELSKKLTAVSKQSELLLIREEECSLKFKQIEEAKVLVEGMQKDVWNKETFVSEKDDVIEKLTAQVEALQKEVQELKAKIAEGLSPVDDKGWLDKAALETALIATDSFEISPTGGAGGLTEEDNIINEDLNLGLMGDGLVDSIEIGDPDEMATHITKKPEEPLSDMDLLKKKLAQSEKDRLSFKSLYEMGLQNMKEYENKIKLKGDEIKTLHCHLAAISNMVHQLGKQKQTAVTNLQSKIEKLQQQIDESDQVRFADIEQIFEEKKDQLVAEQKAVWLQEYQQQLLAANSGMYVQMVPQNYYNYHMQLPQDQHWAGQGATVAPTPSPSGHLLVTPSADPVVQPTEEVLVLVAKDSRTDAETQVVAPPTSAVKKPSHKERTAVVEPVKTTEDKPAKFEKDTGSKLSNSSVSQSQQSPGKKPRKSKQQKAALEEEEEEVYVPKMTQSAILSQQTTKAPPSEGLASAIISESRTEPPKKQQTYDAADKFDNQRSQTSLQSGNTKTLSAVVSNDKKEAKATKDSAKPKKGKRFDPQDDEEDIYVQKTPTPVVQPAPAPTTVQAPVATPVVTSPPKKEKYARRAPEGSPESPEWVPKELIKTTSIPLTESTKPAQKQVPVDKEQPKTSPTKPASSKPEDKKPQPITKPAKETTKKTSVPVLFDSMTLSDAMPKSILMSDILGVKDTDDVDDLLLSDRKQDSDDEWQAVDSPSKKPFEDEEVSIPAPEVIKKTLSNSKKTDTGKSQAAQPAEIAKSKPELILPSTALAESFEEEKDEEVAKPAPQLENLSAGPALSFGNKLSPNPSSALLRDSGFEDPNDEDEWRMSGGGHFSYKASATEESESQVAEPEKDTSESPDKKSKKKKKKGKGDLTPDLTLLIANKK